MKNTLYLFPISSTSWQKVADYEKQTVLALAKKNWVLVVFFDQNITLKRLLLNILKGKGIKFWVEKNKLIKLTPLFLLPFSRIKFINQLNLSLVKYQINLLIFSFFLRKKIIFKKKSIWISHPLSYPYLQFLPQAKLVYDIVDFYYSKNRALNNKIIKYDDLLCKRADWLFVNSKTLLRIKKGKYPKKKFFLVPQGFRIKAFKNPQKLPPQVKEKLKKISSPTIGYIGEINHRLDFKLLLELAGENKKWNFVFVGPKINTSKEDKIARTNINIKKLTSLTNIYFFKKQNPRQIANILKFFDIYIIPYNVQHQFNRYCYPMKTLEYFYLGKPVVSTPILELKNLKPYVVIAKNTKEFSVKISKILKYGWPEKYKKAQKKLAIANSWQNKIEKISQILEKEKSLK